MANPPSRSSNAAARRNSFTPIPQTAAGAGKTTPAKHKLAMVLDEGSKGLSTSKQQYDITGNINLIRGYVDKWRMIPDSNDWKVTPETARLLQHWRHYQFADIRPFFCQVEAVETLIWLTEVAPKGEKARKNCWSAWKPPARRPTRALAPHCAENGDRFGENDRHGHGSSPADHQCPALPNQQ